jgi:hypothetical protein
MTQVRERVRLKRGTGTLATEKPGTGSLTECGGSRRRRERLAPSTGGKCKTHVRNGLGWARGGSWGAAHRVARRTRSQERKPRDSASPCHNTIHRARKELTRDLFLFTLRAPLTGVLVRASSLGLLLGAFTRRLELEGAEYRFAGVSSIPENAHRLQLHTKPPLILRRGYLETGAGTTEASIASNGSRRGVDEDVLLRAHCRLLHMARLATMKQSSKPGAVVDASKGDIVDRVITVWSA